MRRRKTVILFDIDGTLVKSSRDRPSAIALACDEIFGAGGSGVPEVELAGRTDLAIFSELVALMGHEFEQVRERFEGAYYRHLANTWVAGQFETLPGVEPLLDLLGSMRQIELGLITGNAEPAAQIKLSAAGLWDRFRHGAFGHNTTCRNELASQAKSFVSERLGKTGEEMNWVIVGDTPADVACAHHIGAHSIAVATGGCPISRLESSDPSTLLADLNDPAQFLSEIGHLLLA